MYTNVPATATSEYKLSIMKAGSPELGLSAHEVPLSTTSADKIDIVQDLRDDPGVLHLSPLNQAGGNSINPQHYPAGPISHDLSQVQVADFPCQIPETMPTLTSSKNSLAPYHFNNVLSKNKDIFDPIETDGDNPHQQPTFKNVRRLKGASKSTNDTGHASTEVSSGATASHLVETQHSAKMPLNGTHRHLESQISQPKPPEQDVMVDGHDATESEQGLNTLGKAIDSCNNEARSTDEFQLQPRINPVLAQDSSNLNNALLSKRINPTNPKFQTVIDGEPQMTQLAEPIKEREGLVEINHGISREMAGMVNIVQTSASKGRSANEKPSRNKPVAEEAQRMMITEEEKSKEKKPANGKARMANFVEDKSNGVKVGDAKEREAKLDKAQPKKVKQAARTIENPKPLALEKNKLSAEASVESKAEGKQVGNSKRKESAKEKKPLKKAPVVVKQKNASEDQNSQISGDNRGGLEVQKKEQLTKADHNTKISKPIDKVTPKLRNSQKTVDQNSGTPGLRRDSDRARKSMTPAFPESTNKIKLRSGYSTRTPLNGPADSETPLRSSLKRTSQSIRRSASIIDLDTSDVQVSKNPTTPAKKHAHDKESSLGKKIEASLPESKSEPGSSKNKSNASKHSSIKDTLVKKEPIVKTEKIQSKLNNITRDRKMKGRVIDPPIPSKLAVQEEIVLSSDSERSASSFYSDEATPKAGPCIERNQNSRTSKSAASSKQMLAAFKPGSEMATENSGPQISTAISAKEISEPTDKISNQTMKTSKSDVRSSPTPLTPQISKLEKGRSSPENHKGPESEATSSSAHDQSAHKEHLSPVESNIDPQILFSTPCPRPSSPRAPAQYMKPVSINSDSGSDIGSESGSEDDGTTATTETRSDEVKEVRTGSKKEFPNGAQDAKMMNADAMSISHSEMSSQVSQGRSASSKSSGGSRSSRAEHDANEQLQRDCYSSIKPSIAEKPSPTLPKPTFTNKATPTAHSGVNKEHATSSGVRSSSRFTSLTDLKNEKSRGRKNQHVDPTILASSESQAVSQSSSSAGSSSSSNSSSDDDSDSPSARSLASVTKAVNGKGNDSKPRPHKGLGRLIKQGILNKVIPSLRKLTLMAS